MELPNLSIIKLRSIMIYNSIIPSVFALNILKLLIIILLN